jgi:hypothetical protein
LRAEVISLSPMPSPISRMTFSAGPASTESSSSCVLSSMLRAAPPFWATFAGVAAKAATGLRARAATAAVATTPVVRAARRRFGVFFDTVLLL